MVILVQAALQSCPKFIIHMWATPGKVVSFIGHNFVVHKSISGPIIISVEWARPTYPYS